MSPGFLLLSLLIIAAYPSLIWKESNVTSSFLEKRGSFIGRTLTTSSMWILGGYVPTDDVGTDMIEYDIEKGSYIKHQNAYNFGYQNTQSYTQNEDILYMMPSAQNTTNVFDLSSATIIDTISGYIGTSTTSRCLTYYKEYLLFLGGYPATNEFIIYSIQNKTWINSTPIPMTIHSSSCHVVHDILYLIGGYDTVFNIQNTVRIIDISAIPNINTNWNTMENTLSVQKFDHRSVVVDDMIYIIGGMDNTISYTRTVDIIDTNNQIIYPDADLPRSIYLPAVIVANNILYLFCGDPYTSNYVYAVLPFENPTTESPQTSDVTTSIYPTISSSHPTSQPPSSNPVFQPSIQPSLDPSSQPTTSNTIHEQTTSNAVHQTFVNTLVTKKQTIHPSKTPTKVHVTDFDDIEDNDDFDDIEANDDRDVLINGSYMFSIFVLSMLSLVVIIFCACGVKLFQYCKTKQMRNTKIDIELPGLAENACGSNAYIDIDNNNVVASVEAREDIHSTNDLVDEEGPITNGNGQIVDDNGLVMNRRKTVDILRVKTWFEREVKLPIYYDTFINNGYDRLDIIKEINDEKELCTIGIVLKQHRIKILQGIARLNLEGNELKYEGLFHDDNQDVGNRKREGSYCNDIDGNLGVLDTNLDGENRKYVTNDAQFTEEMVTVEGDLIELIGNIVKK